MSKDTVYVIHTPSRDFYTRELIEAEAFAAKNRSEIDTFDSLDAALKQFRLTPLGESVTRDTFLPAVRVSFQERAKIEKEAEQAGLSLGAYIRKQLALD